MLPNATHKSEKKSKPNTFLVIDKISEPPLSKGRSRCISCPSTFLSGLLKPLLLSDWIDLGCDGSIKMLRFSLLMRI